MEQRRRVEHDAHERDGELARQDHHDPPVVPRIEELVDLQQMRESEMPPTHIGVREARE